MLSSAPVALFVYNRPEHTARTLQALRENRHAADTDLIIYSDGPKHSGDDATVAAVRRLFDDGAGFRSVTVNAQERNIGLANSIINGVSEVVNKFDRVIVVEDDLVTHPYALDYFNRMLAHYADCAGVFSVSGYTHPQSIMHIPDDYEFDVYAIPRMQCWGWATWRDRWLKADFSVPDFAQFNSSASATAAYAHWIGADSLNTLRACMNGDKDVWACRWVYTHFKHHAVCLCPTRSLVNNIGLDGSGTNCGPATLFEQELAARPIGDWSLPNIAYVEPRIFESFMQVMDRNRAANRIAVYDNPREISDGGEAVQKNATVSATFAERLAYWAVHPMKLLQRFKEKYQYKRIEELAARVDSEHAKVSSDPSVPLIRLGTEYGGWWVPERGLGPGDFVVSAGAGEDISFDIELAKRYGCEILIMDPTPRAVAHFEATARAVERGEPAAINNSEHEFYECAPADFARLRLRAWGLSHRNATQRFFAPANPKHVSHSIDNLHRTDGGFDAECVTLAEVLRREGHAKISVLKLDIEGAEFDVLDDMLRCGLRPQYVLVEYHAGHSEIERRAKLKTLASLRRLHGQGYRLVKNRGWDYVLERR